MTQSEYEITARDSDNYAMFSSMMAAQFENATRTPIQLFVVDTVVSLFDVYLESLPEEGRQHYNCHTCRHFLNHYGNLVTVDGKDQKSVLWSFDAPPFFRNAVLQMKSLVESSKIVKVFESSSPDMGTPEVGGWDHLAVTLPSFMIYSNRLKTANQAMAESMEAFRTLNNALEEYSQQTADKAVELLTSDTMYRSETVLPVAKAFQEIKREARGNNRYNQVWRGVFNSALVHIKAGMAGSLMDDIKAGLSAQAIKSRFEEKMNPGNYQRAQVAPTQGNVEQAEKIVERLGIVSSLKRRYARFDEIPEFIWKGYQEKKAPGVFANVAVKQEPVTPVNFNLPATTMTWSKFARTVLPLAKTMEVKLDDNPSKFVALVTARDTTAPNILKWDNTFSWYYHGGADADIRQRVESAGGRYANNEIRCSLAWEGGTDLDLHCKAPSPYGHVYYGNKQGILDVDANGGHITSYSPVENMRWPVAAEGGHSFLVRNYCERGTGMTPFKAELEINGMIHSYNGLAHNTGWEEVLFSFDYKRGRPVNLGNSVSSSASWGVAPGSWGKVKGVTTSPDTWGKADKEGHTFFLLEGCKDSAEGKGRGFFNEMLRGDLREIRKTLESYMATATVEGADNADACGVGYSKDGEWNMIVRVTTNSGSAQIVKIDRWD